MKFRIGNRVKILDSEKNDGRFNYGKVIGIDLRSDSSSLKQRDEINYIKSFNLPFYKIAYVDRNTDQVFCDWFAEEEIEKAEN
ncbi:MAG TPA: hypothetical protein VK141_02455 [Nitrosomonas sp.]|nr:hypothetical protein [Nitrosomonas sp.]